MVTVRNKFDTLKWVSEIHTLNEEYENFVSAHMEAVEECITNKARAKHKVPWETLAVRKKQDNVKIAS